MKRLAFLTCIFGGIIILGLIAGTAWLLGTTSGARFLLQQITARSGGTLTVGAIQGRLADELRAHSITLTYSTGELSLQDLHLRCQPALLLTGTLAIDDLRLRNLAIHDRRPPTTEPLTIRWPTLPFPLNRMSGWVNNLSVTTLTYQRQSAPVKTISRVTARVNLHRGQLAVTKLNITAAAGTLTGAAAVGFRNPELDLFADVHPAGTSRLLLHTRLRPGGQKHIAAGTLRAVFAHNQHRGQLTSPVTLSRKQIVLPELSLTEVGRKGTLRGTVSMGFQKSLPDLNISLAADHLDLTPHLPMRTPLNGTVSLSGTTEAFRGAFKVNLPTGSTGQTFNATGTLTGSKNRFAMELHPSSWLDGSLSGTLAADWQEGFSLSGKLLGESLNPGRLNRQLPGVLNVQVTATAGKPDAGKPVQARLSGRLLNSRLRGRPLSGLLELRLAEGNILVEQLLLNGRGVSLNGAGSLDRGISLALRAEDVSGLVPGTRGSLYLNGHLQRQKGFFGGTINGTGRGLGHKGLRIGTVTLTASLAADQKRTVRLAIAGQDLNSGRVHADSFQANVDGTTADHGASLSLNGSGTSLAATVSGHYAAKTWKGTIATLSGRDQYGPWRLSQPAALTINVRGVALSRFVLAGSAGEQFQAKGIWYRSPNGIDLDTDWQQLNLARIGQWLPDLQLTGISTGTLSLRGGQGVFPQINGSAQASGALTLAGTRTQVRRADLKLKTRGTTLEAESVLDLGNQGRGSATLNATLAQGFTLPVRSTFSGQLTGIQLALVRDHLPEGVTMQGTLTAHTQGVLLPGGALRLTAQAAIDSGALSRKSSHGELRADLRQATATLDWHDERMNGTFNLELVERGQLSGTFSLPLPARLAPKIQPAGAVSATLSGTIREQGLVTALLPGLVQESRGELSLDARIGNTWQSPNLSGAMGLDQAGFTLPVAGIKLSEVKVSARLAGDRILIDSLSARSGPGTLSGSGSILFRQWRPVSYQGTLRGERFQFIYLPELQATGSPRLDLSGTPDTLTVRGSFLIPDLQVSDTRTPAPVRPSSDVVIIDAPQKKSATLPFALDAQIRVQFGERVFVKMAGVDARMDGAVDLSARSLNDITGKGLLKVVKGSYKAYGVNLAITRGRLTFDGGPVNRPKLDILATRTVGDVTAGVMIVGTPPRPLVRLYSAPAMSESDIMGYIVLGQPLSGDRNKIGAVMQAAGLFLSASQSALLNEQIIEKFGIDSIGVETDKNNVSQSIVTIGKFITPKLFLSYGRSLFSPASYLKARYTFSERWELETMTGTESSVDLYYKINFN